MLFDYSGGLIYPGETIFELKLSEAALPVVAELQVSDRYGYFIPVDDEPLSGIPEIFQIEGACPNPFNSTTSIRFSLPYRTDLELSVYNVLGGLVRTLRFANMPPGPSSIEWDGTNNAGEYVASGVYLYRLNAGGRRATSRMTLLK
jgi:hypothetical protein